MQKCLHVHDTPFKQCPKCRAKDAAKKRKRTTERRSREHQAYIDRNPWYRTYSSAKARAKEKGIPFDLELSYLKDMYLKNDGYCPVLKVPILRSNPLSIDRIVPHLGYVCTNVRLISHRANTLKNNATVEELKLILLDARRLSNIPNTMIPL